MKKTALFVFNGDPMCFIHVLLNALDFNAKGRDVRIVVEGAATQLLPQLAQTDHPLHQLWNRCLAADLVAGACRACAHKMGTVEAANAQQLPLLADMHGHPSMSAYLDADFEVITF
ncbi:MAG: cytoplasmic protein [Desulfosarcinaceae bacterium]|nr:cytoplasmic protein [Desulfosarcinaceae bacterium]